MSNHVYKSVEITGSSPEGVTQAIDGAIAKASQTLRNLDWFEVTGVRGRERSKRLKRASRRVISSASEIHRQAIADGTSRGGVSLRLLRYGITHALTNAA